jgi:hypothetical protein
MYFIVIRGLIFFCEACWYIMQKYFFLKLLFSNMREIIIIFVSFEGMDPDHYATSNQNFLHG